MPASSSSPRPRARGPRRRLDLAQVVAAAIARVDAGGPEALSIRGVALDLGVMPNAIYTYVADRAELEREIVDALLSRVDLRLLDGPAADWRARLVRYSLALRTVLLAHPGAAVLFMSAPMTGAHALAVGEGLLAALVDAGLDDTAASRGEYLVFVYMLGSVALEIAETDGRPPLPPEPARIAARRAAFAGIDAATHPITARTTDVAAGWISGEQFAWGLERVLDGITAAR
ncbi:MAG: TetR/AcrR family transcriptional regulator C-terminal domain-containing protein [Chloroflexota bacterium]